MGGPLLPAAAGSGLEKPHPGGVRAGTAAWDCSARPLADPDPLLTLRQFSDLFFCLN